MIISSPSNLFQNPLRNKAKAECGNEITVCITYKGCILRHKDIIIEVPMVFLLELDKFTSSIRLRLASSVTPFQLLLLSSLLTQGIPSNGEALSLYIGDYGT